MVGFPAAPSPSAILIPFPLVVKVLAPIVVPFLKKNPSAAWLCKLNACPVNPSVPVEIIVPPVIPLFVAIEVTVPPVLSSGAEVQEVPFHFNTSPFVVPFIRPKVGFPATPSPSVTDIGDVPISVLDAIVAGPVRVINPVEFN